MGGMLAYTWRLSALAVLCGKGYHVSTICGAVMGWMGI